jgi:hypothetical protein
MRWHNTCGIKIPYHVGDIISYPTPNRKVEAHVESIGSRRGVFFIALRISHISCLSGIELVKSFVSCGIVVSKLGLSLLVEEERKIILK